MNGREIAEKCTLRYGTSHAAADMACPKCIDAALADQDQRIAEMETEVQLLNAHADALRARIADLERELRCAEEHAEHQRERAKDAERLVLLRALAMAEAAAKAECPHGYGFDTCTQCHEAYHAGHEEGLRDAAAVMNKRLPMFDETRKAIEALAALAENGTK